MALGFEGGGTPNMLCAFLGGFPSSRHQWHHHPISLASFAGTEMGKWPTTWRMHVFLGVVFKKTLSIHLFLVVLDLLLLYMGFLGCSGQGLLSTCGVWASHWGDFSCCRARALEHRLSCPSTCGTSLGQVDKNPPANAGDTGSIPGPGRSHMLQSN